ncbi:hypothetical protein TRFO_06837 [Tritrichomonas foetus]|uniref:Uncharacterized protein n=1 Tax=Tritrichomonas foetus TaxID=1144522 RepID=A0A1J4JWW4_9EUKA|nr:hypothetical protein TRFO_06837 [Tritrichomonas foetus]|eukprot:OHT03162.1 hypothetical protein TRFO_06837 [Tritrichomonas foetus]
MSSDDSESRNSSMQEERNKQSIDSESESSTQSEKQPISKINFERQVSESEYRKPTMIVETSSSKIDTYQSGSSSSSSDESDNRKENDSNSDHKKAQQKEEEVNEGEIQKDESSSSSSKDTKQKQKQKGKSDSETEKDEKCKNEESYEYETEISETDDIYHKMRANLEQRSLDVLRLQTESNTDFINNLKSAQQMLVVEDGSAFFQEILLQFQNINLNLDVGREILRTIRQLIINPQYFKVFCEYGFIYSLPYKLPAFKDEVLALISDIIDNDFAQLCDHFGDPDYFLSCIALDPYKGLSIINKYAQRCIYLIETSGSGPFDPWSVLDLLYNCAPIFLRTEYYQYYVSLVINVLHSYDTYRFYRIQNYWNLFIGCLTRVDVTILPCIYTTLCYLKDEYIRDEMEIPELPFHQMIDHIDDRLVRSAIITLLASYAQIDPLLIHDEKIIEKLIIYSRRNLKASLVLMKMAEDVNLAEKIFGNGDWLIKGMPEAVDTLRLFLLIFEHQSLREKIVENHNFVPFLNIMIKILGSAGSVALICTVIEKVELTAKLIKKMIKYRFIHTFLKLTTRQADEEKVMKHSAIIMMYSLATHGLHSEFLKYLQWINQVKDDEDLCEEASYLVVELAKDKKLAKKMVKLGFTKFYKAQLKSDSERLQTNSSIFLKKLRGHGLLKDEEEVEL